MWEVFSVGRVQTPTLAMIVARDHEIDHFKPEPYWQVKATFGNDYSGLWVFPETEENQIKKEEEAFALLEKVKGKRGVIARIETTEKSLTPYLLHDLTELQREANRRFHYSASHTLEIAQKLYEKHKVITYPRTDSRYLTQDLLKTIPTIFQRLTVLPEYQTLVQGKAYDLPPHRYVNNAKVKDHHAILPTTGSLNASLTLEEHNIFDLIVRRFLSLFYPPHLYLITKVRTHCEKEQFLTQGKIITQEGWKQCYHSEEEIQDQETPLPPLKEGESRLVTHVEKLDKKTQAPKRYTEGTLLSAMETAGKHIDDEALRSAMRERGLGTPATRAGILENLKKKQYIQLVKKNIQATEKGKTLIQLIPPEIISPQLTGEWEYRLRNIEDGKEEADRFLKDIYHFVATQVTVGKSTPKIPFHSENSQKQTLSPESESSDSLETSGKSKGKKRASSKTKKSTDSKNSKNSKNTEEDAFEESTENAEKGKTERKELGTCPKCHNGTVLDFPKSFSCNRYQEGCNFTIWKQYARRTTKFTEAKTLIKHKETKLLQNFKSREGKAFPAYLYLDPHCEVKIRYESTAKV